MITSAQPNKLIPPVDGGGHWASNFFNDAISQNIVLPNELPDWDAPINRYEMARLMVRTLEN